MNIEKKLALLLAYQLALDFCKILVQNFGTVSRGEMAHLF